MIKEQKQWPPASDLEHVQELEVALEREFPAAAAEIPSGFSRRRWLQLMGASLALGGIIGCRDRVEKITPFAFRPKNRIPGIPQQFATTIDRGGVGIPLLATCNDGRPTKLDGNPDHPVTRGSSDVFTQGTILDLYDPDRSREVTLDGAPSIYDDFLVAARGLQVDGMYIIAEPDSSPTLARLKQKLIDKGAKWFEYTPINDDNCRAGTKMSLGKPYRLHYRFDRAKTIVLLDADPLGVDPDTLQNTHRFAASRNPEQGWMSRVYSVASTMSVAGGQADHRVAIRSELIGSFLSDLEGEIAKQKDSNDSLISEDLDKDRRVLIAMAKDLAANPGAGLIVVGERQPPEVHARAMRINNELENLGKTIEFTEFADEDRKSNLDQIAELMTALREGKAKSLLIVGGNPAYDAPTGDGSFAELLGKTANTIHFSVMPNETSRLCSWQVNAAHPLESWGDAIAYDGSWCIRQPLINPLFDGHSAIELLADLLDEKKSSLELVQETAKAKWGDDGFESKWNSAVRKGFVEGSEADAQTVSLRQFDTKPGDVRWRTSKNWDGQSLELVFETSRSLYDGRYGNNGWLQELPNLFTKLTWDNALLINPKTASELKLTQAYLANVKFDGNDYFRLPVMVQPGMADGTVAVAIGYGRTAAGRVGGDTGLDIKPVGVDVNPLRAADHFHTVNGVEVDATSTPFMMAYTQEPATMDATARHEINRRMGAKSSLLRRDTFDSFQKFKKEQGHTHGNGKDKHATNQYQDSRPQRPLTSVAFRNLEEPDEKSAADKSHDDHGHGGHHWPGGHHPHPEFELTPGPPLREDVRWGMSIDLNKCTGCHACVISCQAENNIPIVGKEQVWRGREMHWLRIDRYYPSPDNDDKLYEKADMVVQPVTCHQCENAPCETVCPVAATVHSDEGLNDMVYNRCIGTRYCGNNCPYKVRRFNYLNYSNAQTFVKYPGADAWPTGGGALAINGGSPISEADQKLMSLVYNPDVTIRSRGVMEKCTYCVQRIQNTKILARNESRPIGPNEIKTACQDACPADAIEFGNLADKESRVHAAQEDVRAYTMLEVLNNRPRTKYLARVTNPHPGLVSADDQHHGVAN